MRTDRNQLAAGRLQRAEDRPRSLPDTHRRWVGRCLLSAVCCLLVLAVGCRQQMADQPSYRPLTKSSFFGDDQSARPLVPGTVAQGYLRADERFYVGKSGGDLVTALPVPLTRELLERGQERFNIFCSPCHDRAGNGAGMVVQRGYRRPPSFHIDRLREAPIGQFFDVITRGFGVMPDYAAEVPPADRWAIVAYIRALQLSQNATLADVPPQARQQLEGKKE